MVKKKIIVVGGGFAGIQLIRKLDERYYDVLLIDKLNHHQFQPLFYQVASSQIEPSSISFPLRNIFKRKKLLQIRLAEVLSVNETNKKITTSIGDFDYDYLVLAIGCKTNFFGNREIEKNAFTLKSTLESIDLRNHILQTFEDIISATESEKEALLNLVIVGGGATGVELAGAFSEIKRNVLPKDYHGFDFTKFKIILVEGSKNTLNNMSEKAKKASRYYLEKMGVEIRTETRVENYDGETLTLKGGETIKSKTVIWSAGVIGNFVDGFAKENFTHGNRFIVDRLNKLSLSESVYAVGDIAYMETPKYAKGHPQVANVAINQAKNLAKNFNREARGKAKWEFEYKDLGSMATVGRNKAVVDFSFMKLKGYFAWLIWMFLHLMLILSVRNKLIIFINWAWSYITKDSALRLIFTQKPKK